MANGYWKLVDEGDGWDNHYDTYEWYERDEDGDYVPTGETSKRPSKWNTDSPYNRW